MYKKIIAVLFFVTVSFLLVSCDEDTVSTQTQTTTTTINTVTETENLTDFIDLDINFENGYYKDYTDESYIVLNDDSESYEITVAGTYVLEGTITETVVINVGEEEDVRLVLNNVTISSSVNQAIIVLSADDVWVSVPEGTTNYIADSENYTEDNLEFNATIYSDSDLVINGSGYLEIEANYNNAIASKDDLMICDVTINITSVDDGIIGRDSLLMQNVTMTLTTEGDSFKATNNENAEDGYIYIESGVFVIDSKADGFDAVNLIIVVDGEFEIKAGSNAFTTDTDIYITGGTFNLVTESDTFTAGRNLYISGGDMVISSGDDGIKAAVEIVIDGGTIEITDCYEGIEAPTITINGGIITVTASDDAINAADGSGGLQTPEAQTSAAGTLYINGGLITLSADGDCIDVNGTIYMTGGEVYAYGLDGAPDSAIDYNIACNLSGGVIFGVGSSRMAMAPSAGSTQSSIMLVLSSSLNSNSLITVTDSFGDIVFEATTQRSGDNVVISFAGLIDGEEYNVSIEGVMDVDFKVDGTVTYLDEFGITDELIEEGPGGMPPIRPGR